MAALRQREFLLTGAAQALLVLQSIVQMKLLTNYLTVDSFGVWTLLISLTSLVVMLPFSAFDQAIPRLDAEQASATDRAGLIGRALWITLGLFALWMVAGVALAWVPGFHTVGATLLGPFLAYTLGEILKGSAVAIANGRRNRTAVVAWRLLDLVLRVCVLGVPFVTEYAPSLAQIVWALAAANVAIVACALVVLRPRWRGTSLWQIRATLSELTSFAWPLVTWATFGWLQTTVNRWYLAAFLDTDAVAIYSIAVSISFFLPNFLYTVVASFIQPIVYRSTAAYSARRHWQLVGSMFGVLALLAAAMLALAEPLVLLLSSPNYLSAAKWVPFLTLTSAAQVAAMVSTVQIYRAKQTQRLLLPSVAPGLLSLILGFLLVRSLGLPGAIITYAAGQALYAVLVLPVTTASVTHRKAKADDGSS